MSDSPDDKSNALNNDDQTLNKGDEATESPAGSSASQREPAADSDGTPKKQPEDLRKLGILLDIDDIDLSRPDTAILSRRNLSRRLSSSKTSDGTVTFGDQRELLLVIRGIVERLVVPNELSITLGRSDLSTRFHPDVDLTAYGALDRGVSREHARLHTEDGRLYVTDLGSTNGTFLAGKRLEPNNPTLLRKGDELLLGRLTVQVLFR
jgi:hypothetical protein